MSTFFPTSTSSSFRSKPFPETNELTNKTNNSSVRRPLVAAFASRGDDENGSSNEDDNKDDDKGEEEEKEAAVDLDAPPSGPGAAGALSLPLAGADTDWREFRARLVGATTSAAAAAEEIEASTSETSTSEETSPSPLARAARSRSSSSSSPSSPASSSSSAKLWAHPLSRPERGCILVAHPLLFTSTQTYFFKSVVFLIEHDDGETEFPLDDEGESQGEGSSLRGGTCGLILNKPTTITLNDVGGGVAPLLPAFGDSTLFLGGDVERSSLHVVHGIPDLRGSLEVVSGVRVGGVDAAAEAVKEGRAVAGDFKFLHGYCGWAPGQLEREFRSGAFPPPPPLFLFFLPLFFFSFLSPPKKQKSKTTGVWFAAAASAEVLLRGAALAAAEAEAAENSSPSSPSAPSPPSLRSGGDAMWHAVLELMGGEHAAMSRALRRSSDAVKRQQQQQQRPPSGESDEERR